MRLSLRVLHVTLLVGSGCGGGVQFPADGAQWPAAVAPDYASKPRFAITVNLADTLAFVSADAQAPAMFGAFPVGNVPVELEGPHHIAASPDGQYVYVNLSNYVPGSGSGPHGSHGLGTVPGSLVKLDARTGRRVGEALVDRSPGDVILSKDGATAYVTHYDLLRLQQQLSTVGAPPETGYSDVAIVDTASMTRLIELPTCPTAHGEGLSPDERTLYVSCAQSDELAIVDVSDRSHPTIVRKIPIGPTPGTPGTPSYAPYALAVSPSDGTVWVSNNLSGDVRVYDPATGQMDPQRVFATGGVTMFAAFSTDGKVLYVPSQGNEQITRIDTVARTTRVVPLPPASCRNAHAFVLAPDGQNAVVICEGDHVKLSGTAVFMTAEPLTVTGFTDVGLFPDGAAWLPPAP
jgi:DNA-binding beta-propeller fold protein YncE